MIERECFNKLTKLILEEPKYLVPLVDKIDVLSSSLTFLVNEPATWNSFSGSLAKIAKNRKSISSERGLRYFGPSKMSFVNLLKHSLSIVTVFKTALLIRSVLFLIVYLFLMIGKISVITVMPVIGVLIVMFSVIVLSKRENMSEFNSSLENIISIDKVK